MYASNSEDISEYKESFEVDWLPGMGSIFHSMVYEKLGPLDDIGFPQYHGDADYTYRAKSEGFTITVYPELVIYNDKSNSSLTHDNTWKSFFRSLNSIRSNYDIKKDLLFYRKYARSPFAWFNLLEKYFIYFGSFIKWKFLGMFGIKRKT